MLTWGTEIQLNLKVCYSHIAQNLTFAVRLVFDIPITEIKSMGSRIQTLSARETLFHVCSKKKKSQQLS